MKTVRQGISEPGLIAREPLKRNRVVIAGVLVLLMGGLWVRVFWKNASGPGKAAAASGSNAAPFLTPSDSPTRLAYVGLPFESGRHDQLGTDVFSTANWEGVWNTSPIQIRVDPVPVDDAPARARQMFSRMTVEGIMNDGAVLEAMIQHEGKYYLVRKGQTFEIKQADRLFTFTIEDIVSNRVTVAWETVQHEMAMVQPVTGD
ncbi:MAG: hypothetical protein JW828_04635 [Sedimentisphaerales bacterium]|nr:hypothetical protein [Sedimentisphaerales bacterium]